jgi:hypothetical protein
MKVRLTRKYADRINGIDLRGREPGDLLDLEPRDARLLLAEEWATVERRHLQGGSSERRRADDRQPSDKPTS